MRMRKVLIGLICVLVILAALLGSVIAYMFRQTQVEENNFIPAQVSCRVNEKTTDNVDQKTEITVTNTGNIDAYIRVRFVSYWVRPGEGGSWEIAPKASKMPAITLAEGWIQGPQDTYYFTTPVAPGADTGNLLATPMVLAVEDNCYQVVEVFAEAIQSLPEKAVENSWHVTVSDGRITAAP